MRFLEGYFTLNSHFCFPVQVWEVSVVSLHTNQLGRDKEAGGALAPSLSASLPSL